MPRFYFHLINDIDVPDEEGKELPDLAAARAHALAEARIMAGELLKEAGRLVLSHRIDIENDRAEVLDTVYFHDAMVIES